MRTGDSSKTTYRVDYYVKSRYSSEPDKFLHSNYYDNPVAIEFRKDSLGEHSVIEEVKTITFGDYENVTLPKKGSKAAPKLGKRDVQGDTVLHVHSASLLNALRAVVKYSSNAPIHGKVDIFKEGAFPYPYHDLFHYKEDLMAYKTPTVGLRAMHTSDYNEECDRHIDILIEYLYNEPTIQLAAFEAGLKKATPTVTFAGFWLLVKPGCDVYVSEQNQLNAYVVDSVGGGVNHASYSRWAVMPSSYSVRVWSLVFDGKVIRRKSKIIQVPVFDNELDILSLPVFPTQFHDTHDEGARRKELIARGKQFFAYSRGPAYLEYTGIGLKPGWKNYNRTRVVVEHESRPWNATEFSEMISWHFGCTNEHEKDCAVCSTLQGIGTQARCARCECNPCAKALDPKEEYIPVTFGDYDEIDPRKVQDLSEHQYLVCSSHMFGFILKDRTYDYVDIGGLDEPRIVTDAIDQLVLRPESNKKTIKAIAKTYTDKYDSNELFKADLIRGKGEGQIFLLHGPPGTGKTLTAESIAEFTRRPLLSITAADLGHQPDELEYNLLRFFKNAKLWDGIVLLDEADVYLERRSTNDLMRNSIVSVFLRALEYFQGILFLTTNRVGHFDEAFLSRIHVSIGYEPLDNDARVQIWDGLFRKLIVDHKNGGPEITFEREAKRYVQKDEDVRALNWNGREIRNAFQTAVALAVFDANEAREKGKPEKDCIPEITETHLAQVVRMSTAFKQYIRDTHEGLEDADLAMKLGNRDDKSNQHVARDSTLK
ncbi:P-loop containing nucleoside triphosphate hydrolase protein [Viridothelium virens]|uniref:P-loop containing nucleoside triphosphate hydrolase protein n=1 Tax=Viridothelium virens TaxID=1048519 RepID=A0A6A6HFC8_VIRVR|nr:P-loop containing nucleoside triphosphate hydrolase protein [Viridothelium virens]